MPISITLTVSDANAAEALTAINALAGKKIELTVHDDDFNGDWEYSYEVKQGGESNQQFAKRFLKEMAKAHVILFDVIEGRIQYRADVAAVPTHTPSVPDDIFE